MLEQMPARQLVEWLAFYTLEPFGEERQDARFAILDTLVARSAGSKKAKPEHFMLVKPKKVKATTAAEVETLLMSIYEATRDHAG